MEADRRTMLVTGAAAMLAAAAPVRQRREDMLIVNALGGFENPNLWPEDKSGAGVEGITRGPLDPRVLADAHHSGMNAVNITLGYVAGPMEPFEYSVAEIGACDARLLLHPHDLLKVLTAADILRAKREGRIGLIYGFQNAAMMGDK